jgi:DNA-binding MarR family transcriptional regulator
MALQTRAEAYRTMARLRRFFESVRSTITTAPATGGLTAAQQFALLTIAGTPSGQRCTVGELARQTYAALNTTSALIGRMERAGLVRTARSADDRRVVYLRLTPLGQRRLRTSTLAVVTALRAAADEQGRAALRDAFESWFDNWSAVITALSADGARRSPKG